MGASKKFKDIEVSWNDVSELLEKLTNAITEIQALQPNTDVKASGKITLQYYVDEDNIQMFRRALQRSQSNYLMKSCIGVRWQHVLIRRCWFESNIQT